MTDVDRGLASDEFYIGYYPVAPPAAGRAARRRALGFVALGLVTGIGIAATQGPFETSSFEYGRAAGYEGRLSESPFPELQIPRPGLTDRGVAYSRYFLVAPGKHGAAALAQGWNGQWVRLTGALIFRQDQTMLEVAPGSVTRAEQPAPALEGPSEDLGVLSLEGEIVDGKCFLGAMNPASRTGHRGCAVRCLSGGIPPLLAVRDSAGVARYLLLVGPRGEVINGKILPLVGVPVRVTGRVVRDGDQFVLRAAVENIETLR